MQHSSEREKLIVGCRQENLQVHSQAARTMARQAGPFCPHCYCTLSMASLWKARLMKAMQQERIPSAPAGSQVDHMTMCLLMTQQPKATALRSVED